MNFIVDACIAVKWGFEEEFSKESSMLLDDHFDLYAPDILLYEVANVIWKKSRQEEIPNNESIVIYHTIKDQFLMIHSTIDLIEETLSIADLLRHPIYDCLYLSMAKQFDIPLVTADSKFFNIGIQSQYSKYLVWIADVSNYT